MGFEPTTIRLEGGRPIRLGYQGKAPLWGHWIQKMFSSKEVNDLLV